MLSKIYTTSLLGLEGSVITVETDTASGMVSFFMVGLPDAAVREAKERVSAAMKNNGFTFPVQKVTINLAPADLPKDAANNNGSSYYNYYPTLKTLYVSFALKISPSLPPDHYLYSSYILKAVACYDSSYNTIFLIAFSKGSANSGYF